MKKLIILIITTLILTGCTVQTQETKQLTITGPSFSNNTAIFQKHTCKGFEINPELDIQGIPEGTKSLALIVDDPDAPFQTFTHWLVWNIKPVNIIAENSVPGTQGTNDVGAMFYKGPCPPAGLHHYYFKVYALDAMLNLTKGAEKNELEKAMKNHILAYGEIVAIYRK